MTSSYGRGRLLPQWAPVVDAVTECSPAGEAVGEVRRCNVRLAGRSGRMVERCTEFTPMSRIAYVVDDESFGMRRLFEHYGFAINLESAGPDETGVASKRITRPETRSTESSTGWSCAGYSGGCATSCWAG